MHDISFLKNINIDDSWKDYIYKESNLLELKKIEREIGKNYFPLTNSVFRFLETNLFKIKYIILGMDPYPSHFIENGKIIPIATGRSFEVKNIKSWKEKYKQKSLSMIIKTLYYDKYNIEPTIDELRNRIIEIDYPTANKIINNIKIANKEIIKDLIIKALDLSTNDLNTINKDKKIILFNPASFYDITELQGILWLNSTLTVKPENSGSHISIWNDYMNELFRYIVSNNNSIKYLIFGEKANNRIKDIVSKEKTIVTCHPATRMNNTFVQNDCFKELKDILLYI